jgi:hypothetical protein
MKAFVVGSIGKRGPANLRIRREWLMDAIERMAEDVKPVLHTERHSLNSRRRGETPRRAGNDSEGLWARPRCKR